MKTTVGSKSSDGWRSVSWALTVRCIHPTSAGWSELSSLMTSIGIHYIVWDLRHIDVRERGLQTTLLYLQNTQGDWEKGCNSVVLIRNPTFSDYICHVRGYTGECLCKRYIFLEIFKIYEHFNYVYTSSMTYLLHTDTWDKQLFTLLLGTLLLKTSWYTHHISYSLQVILMSSSQSTTESAQSWQ